MALRVGESTLGRMGSLVLDFVLGTLALYGLDRYPAGLLIQFAADIKPAGICS